VTDTIKLEGDDGKVHEVALPIARKLIHIERLARQIIDILDNGTYPAQRELIEIANLREETALFIAQRLREKTGKFQMAREAVAEWIEEGGWKR